MWMELVLVSVLQVFMLMKIFIFATQPVQEGISGILPTTTVLSSVLLATSGILLADTYAGQYVQCQHNSEILLTEYAWSRQVAQLPTSMLMITRGNV